MLKVDGYLRDAEDMARELRAALISGPIIRRRSTQPTLIVMHPDFERAMLLLDGSGMDEFAQYRSIRGVQVERYDPYQDPAIYSDDGLPIMAQVQWRCDGLVVQLKNICLDRLPAFATGMEGRE